MNITLELVDVATGAVIAESEAPLDTLPESFAGLETTLTVGDAEYHVVRAEPETRGAIARAGAVKLSLRKVVAVDPKSVLFSMPTIENALPHSAKAPDGVEVSLRINADDWRQVEFVTRAQSTAIDSELDAVRAVLADKRSGPGFTAIHTRTRVPSPLDGAAVSLADVEAALGAKARAFGIRGEAPAVVGGFAIPCAEALVYGTALEGHVTTLGIFGMPDDAVGLLHPVALAHGLVFVDWCRTRRLYAYEEGLGEPAA